MTSFSPVSGVDVGRLAACSTSLVRRQRRRPLDDLDAHQLRRHRLAEAAEHRLEQLEGFGLVLVQRVALGVAAEADHLAEMVERDQMLAPEMVERLQQHRLLDLAHDLGREADGALRRRISSAARDDALAHLLVGDALFLGPVLDRQIEVEDLLRPASCRPATSHCSG